MVSGIVTRTESKSSQTSTGTGTRVDGLVAIRGFANVSRPCAPEEGASASPSRDLRVSGFEVGHELFGGAGGFAGGHDEEGAALDGVGADLVAEAYFGF